MIKKCLFLILVLSVVAGIVWAGGGKDTISRSAEDPSGFTDRIDTSERKPGKYNYYLEAADRAGNTTRSGPDNIYIDPESDLPRITIVNPLPYMRVQGNMNIVGLAFDDDGVGSVELVVNRGTDGRGEELLRITASGTDFWSHFLDTSDSEIWTDGNYTITAWAIDINGLSGISEAFKPKQHKKAVVHWLLDRKKPETIITSHEVGALVSGNVRLRGTVFDGNGINSFAYSVDEGVTYLPVKTNVNRATGEHSWEINISTRRLEDGPNVIWFRAVDGNGSVGSAAHLLFVNNAGPEVKIIYPEPTEIVSGLFPIAAFAQHPVGLSKVTWKAGNIASGEFEFLPGNHWYSAMVDIRNQKLTNIDIEIRAEDVSGNVTVARQRYRVDQARDLPIVTLTSPVPGVIDGARGLIVSGTATDNHGISSIFYSLNAGVAEEIPCTGYFQFLVPDVPEGNHMLEVWAKDVTGVIGPRVIVRGIVVSSAPTEPGIASFSWGRVKTESFYTGMIISPVPILNARTGAVTGFEPITMTLAYKAPAAPITSFYQIGDRAALPVRLAGSRDIFTGAVAFPSDLEDGLTRIRLTATDRNGREYTYDEYIFINKQMVTIEYDNVFDEFGDVIGQTERRVMPPTDYEFAWVRQNLLEDGRILLDSQDDYIIGISSIPITNATITGNNLLSVQVDDKDRVILRAIGEGNFQSVTVRLELDGDTPKITPAIRIVSDFSGPIITMQNVPNNTWVRNQVPIRFGVTGRSRITAVEFSTDMGANWTSFGAITADYNRTLDITNATDGSTQIMIRAANETGKIAYESFTVLKDTAAPEVQLIMPIEEARVNGTIRLAFAVEDAGSINTIVYNRPARTGAPAITREVFNASSWDYDYEMRFIEVLMDSTQMPLDQNMRFTFTDKAGNSTEYNQWHFVISPEDDIPVVHVILPQENEVITSDFIVSGVMFDDDGIKNAQWRLNNGPWQVVEAEYGFSIPIAISTLTDNEHSVSVFAEDIYGVRSQPVTRRFRVSLAEPAATMTWPAFNTVVRDVIELRGTAFDRNGIKTIQVSLDNGNTYNTVRGTFGTAAETVQWTYQFNTRILKDGPHVVFIRVWDRFDVQASYAQMINIDNSPPEIILDSPGDGSISVGTISVMGRVMDANLSEIDIQLRSLDGVAISQSLRSRKIEPAMIIRENFDLTAQADGHYNIAIVATDLAGNITRVSRNFELARQSRRNFVEVYYPLDNEDTAGQFNLYGFAGGSDKPGDVTIRINGRDLATTQADDSGFFRFALDQEYLTAGANAIIVHSNFGGATQVPSRAYNLNYQDGGPWVTIDSFSFGDFAYERPYLFGRMGYTLSEEDREALADRNTDKETRAKINAKQPDFTEISFNNGRSFIKMGKGKGKGVDYRHRLETGEMPEGMHYIIVRATMKNGEIAVTRMLVQVDKTPPVIRLISPEPGATYNKAITYSATASDDNELVSLTYHLRPGDKARYEIPGFLQGLYVESTIPPFLRQIFNGQDGRFALPSMPFAGGPTYMDVGLGLSFFDDNVKIQATYGFITQDIYEQLGGTGKIRYGGHVLGIKLLASIYTLPFGSFLGPDWDWLSATFAIGANFSLFDIANQGYTQSGTPTWLSALLFQIEFPRITLPKRKYLRTFSLFTEGQMWFVPTDVDANTMGIDTIIPKVVMGLRLYIF